MNQFIDGDFVESFLILPAPQQQVVLEAMNLMEEVTIERIVNILEEVSRIH